MTVAPASQKAKRKPTKKKGVKKEKPKLTKEERRAKFLKHNKTFKRPASQPQQQQQRQQQQQQQQATGEGVDQRQKGSPGGQRALQRSGHPVLTQRRSRGRMGTDRSGPSHHHDGESTNAEETTKAFSSGKSGHGSGDGRQLVGGHLKKTPTKEFATSLPDYWKKVGGDDLGDGDFAVEQVFDDKVEEGAQKVSRGDSRRRQVGVKRRPPQQHTGKGDKQSAGAAVPPGSASNQKLRKVVTF